MQFDVEKLDQIIDRLNEGKTIRVGYCSLDERFTPAFYVGGGLEGVLYECLGCGLNTDEGYKVPTISNAAEHLIGAHQLMAHARLQKLSAQREWLFALVSAQHKQADRLESELMVQLDELLSRKTDLLAIMVDMRKQTS